MYRPTVFQFNSIQFKFNSIQFKFEFPIIQGGCDPRLRAISLHQLMQRDSPGYAIGGLVGGESKEDFWRTVAQCTAGMIGSVLLGQQIRLD